MLGKINSLGIFESEPLPTAFVTYLNKPERLIFAKAKDVLLNVKYIGFDILQFLNSQEFYSDVSSDIPRVFNLKSLKNSWFVLILFHLCILYVYWSYLKNISCEQHSV